MKSLKIGLTVLVGGLIISCSTTNTAHGKVYRAPDGTIYRQGQIYKDRNGIVYRNGQIYRMKSNAKQLPPGQAKKIFGGSAKDYAPGQVKKRNNRKWK